MLKYPQPGAVKTRMIPALGARRACELHRALTAQTLAEVRSFAARTSVELEARVAGAPDAAASEAWLGAGVMIREQGEGDLGARMERAVRLAFDEGAGAVVVIGGDCPELTAGHLASAFEVSENGDVVLGPATDGGYYLIGLRRPRPELFRGITWGGAEVRAQTLAVARGLGAEVVEFEPLRDVDVPEDLAVWARTPAAQQAGRGGVSVIIPARNEAAHLPATLAAIRREAVHEVIVVDGGSTDGTMAIARADEAIVLESAAGRAAQMNRGAAAATGEFLLFLHADTLLPPNYPELVRATLAGDGVVAGAFEFKIADDFPGRGVIERGTNRRARNRQLPYGDQGLFVRREVFERVGGFPEQPIMEDYEFVRRLRRLGTIVIAPAPAITSGRRWRRRGAVVTTLINQLIVLGYRLGVAPARLARWYRGV
jgi:hypothetical protein